MFVSTLHRNASQDTEAQDNQSVTTTEDKPINTKHASVTLKKAFNYRKSTDQTNEKCSPGSAATPNSSGSK